jgi:hypothetical protein
VNKIGERLVKIVAEQQILHSSRGEQIPKNSVLDWRRQTKDAEKRITEVIADGLYLEKQREDEQKKASEAIAPLTEKTLIVLRETETAGIRQQKYVSPKLRMLDCH